MRALWFPSHVVAAALALAVAAPARAGVRISDLGVFLNGPEGTGHIVLLLALAVAAPARAELRISDLDVFLNDHEVTVHVVLLGAVPEALNEGIQSGIPAHIRLVIARWQYQRLIPARLLLTDTH